VILFCINIHELVCPFAYNSPIVLTGPPRPSYFPSFVAYFFSRFRAYWTLRIFSRDFCRFWVVSKEVQLFCSAFACNYV